MATLHALSTWYNQIPRDKKLKIYMFGTLCAMGGLMVRSYYRNKAKQQETNNNTNNANGITNPPTANTGGIAFQIPLSFHKTFWCVLYCCHQDLIIKSLLRCICYLHINT